MNDLVLKIHSMGLTTVPSENPTDREYQRYLRELLSLETGMTVAIRFEIGNTLIELNIEPGEKFIFCQDHFGERASMMMECMKIAREWVFNQNVGWSWSHYRTIYTRSKQDKLDLIKQYKEKRIKTVEDLKEACARMDAALQKPQIPPKRDQIVHVHDLKQGKPSFIEAEFKPLAPALPPPPNTVNTGQLCVECGEPSETTVCQECYDNVADVSMDGQSFTVTTRTPLAPVVGFKVEGQSVERLTYAPPTRWTPEEEDVPPYLRTRAPDGLRDGPRPAVSAAVVIATDDPCVVYARCEVPVGGLAAGSLFTVAIHRDQLR